MRFYDIQITQPQYVLDAFGTVKSDPTTGQPMPNPNVGKPVINPVSRKPFTYTSLLAKPGFIGGNTNPGALNIELDFISAPFAQPAGIAWLRIWGISIQDISQVASLVGNHVTITAGMQKGLPLANPKQAGVILKGTINQALGNWIGVDQTLDIYVTACADDVGTPEQPINLTLNWQSGTKLAEALKSSLSTAFPGLKQDIQISDKLVQNYDEVDAKATLTEFSSWLQQKTAALLGGNYGGVQVVVDQDTIRVFDATARRTSDKLKSPNNPLLINFWDLIGQPTWIESLTIQFKCPMRGDLVIGDYVKLPTGVLTTTTQASQIGIQGSKFKDRTSFTGAFMVQQVRYVGNFRQADAASWVTVVNAIFIEAPPP